MDTWKVKVRYVRVLKLDEINGVSDCFEEKTRKKMEVKE